MIKRRIAAEKTSQLSAHIPATLVDEFYQKIVKERIGISWVVAKLIEGFLKGEFKIKMFEEDK